MRYDVGWYRPRPQRYDERLRGNPRIDEPRFPHGPYDRGQPAAPDPLRLHGPARYGLGPYFDRLRTRRRSDEELQAEVEDALFFDTWVDADAIEVDVREGVVTLRGELPSYDEVRFATDDAWDIDGVVGVRTELRVRDE